MEPGNSKLPGKFDNRMRVPESGFLASGQGGVNGGRGRGTPELQSLALFIDVLDRLRTFALLKASS